MDEREKSYSRKDIRWAKDHGMLAFRALTDEPSRVQVERLQIRHFGPWSDIFSGLENCSGRVLLCIYESTVIGYQAFETSSSKGNPFPPDKLTMRLTYVVVREDSGVKARHLGIGTQLLKRTLDLAWQRGYDAVYTYATAYELMIKGGLRPHGGDAVLQEAKYVRDLDPDRAPALLFVRERETSETM